jgi:preprotein translocase subunit Sss1
MKWKAYLIGITIAALFEILWIKFSSYHLKRLVEVGSQEFLSTKYQIITIFGHPSLEESILRVILLGFIIGFLINLFMFIISKVRQN